MSATVLKSQTALLVAEDDAVMVNGFPSTGAVAVQLVIEEGFDGTVTFETTVNNTDWVAMELTDSSDSTVVATTASTSGAYSGPTLGYAGMRAILTTPATPPAEPEDPEDPTPPTPGVAVTIRYAAT